MFACASSTAEVAEQAARRLRSNHCDASRRCCKPDTKSPTALPTRYSRNWARGQAIARPGKFCIRALISCNFGFISPRAYVVRLVAPAICACHFVQNAKRSPNASVCRGACIPFRPGMGVLACKPRSGIQPRLPGRARSILPERWLLECFEARQR